MRIKACSAPWNYNAELAERDITISGRNYLLSSLSARALLQSQLDISAQPSAAPVRAWPCSHVALRIGERTKQPGDGQTLYLTRSILDLDESEDILYSRAALMAGYVMNFECPESAEMRTFSENGINKSTDFDKSNFPR